MAKVKPDAIPPEDEPSTTDGPPEVPPKVAREIDKASTVGPDDLDDARDLWARYAGGLTGLWDAQDEA
jgi:hypothetical protein